MPTSGKPMRIASFLIQRGVISLEQAQTVIREQAENSDPERFGTIAVRRGFISESTLDEVLQEHCGQGMTSQGCGRPPTERTIATHPT